MKLYLTEREARALQTHFNELKLRTSAPPAAPPSTALPTALAPLPSLSPQLPATPPFAPPPAEAPALVASCGIQNESSQCYANAVIQMLFSNVFLRNAVLKQDLNAPLAGLTHVPGQVMTVEFAWTVFHSVQDIFQAMEEAVRNGVGSIDIQEHLVVIRSAVENRRNQKKASDSTSFSQSPNEQEDAQEFLIFILESMERLKMQTRATFTMGYRQKCSGQSKKPEPIEKGFELTQPIHESVWKLYIPKKKTTTLVDIIKSEMDGWERMKGVAACLEQGHLYLWRQLVLNVDDVGTLFISLARTPGQRVPVLIPLRLNNFEPPFTLSGVCLHKGGTDWGHYTYASIINEGEYTLYNDDRIETKNITVDGNGFIKNFSKSWYICMYDRNPLIDT